MKKALLVEVWAVLLLGLASGCSTAPPLSPWESPPSSQLVEERGTEAMGTSFRIRIWKAGADDRARDQAYRAAMAEIARVAKIADPEDAKSEISQVNLKAAKGPVRVSPDLFHLLTLGQQMNSRSSGVFDVTFVRLQDETEKYGEKTGLTSGVNEAAADVDHALKTSVGSRNLALDAATRQIRFTRPGMKVGVLGLAKGYAVQKAAEQLQAMGVAGFAVLGGGTLAASGKALSDPNLMCVEHPNDLGTCAFRILPKGSGPVFYLAASAVLERPGHIYNAKNGMRKARAGGVTVSAADGASAQAAATAASAMDNQTTLRFLQSQLSPSLSGVFFESDYSVKLFGTLEPFAKTVPVKR
jgi:thiamine biosynthesis lipoprotein